MPTPPNGIKIIQYADDISIYAVGRDIEQLSRDITDFTKLVVVVARFRQSLSSSTASSCVGRPRKAATAGGSSQREPVVKSVGAAVQSKRWFVECSSTSHCGQEGEGWVAGLIRCRYLFK